MYDGFSSYSKFSSKNLCKITATAMQINEKIKAARTLKGWTQEQIADAINEKRTSYSGWEKEIIPSFDIVVKIAKATGMPMTEFIRAVDEDMANGFSDNDDNSSVALVKEPSVSYGKRIAGYYIELKTASGKTLKVKPEGETEINLLNAFLEERDRVITSKQDQIIELAKDKEDLFKLLNSDLADISKVQQAIFAMARTLQQHEAVMTSSGNKKREVEMLDTLSKLNGDNLKVDAKQDNAVVLRK